MKEGILKSRFIYTMENIMLKHIDWKYFFGTPGHRYYYSIINGVRVEKYCGKKCTEYAIGNIDEAKKKYKSEVELTKRLKKFESWINDEINPFLQHNGKWVQACGNSTEFTTEELYKIFLKYNP